MEIQDDLVTDIYAEIWTPFTFSLSRFSNHTILNKLEIHPRANEELV